MDIAWLRPHETLSYDYSGYRAFTHLSGLPHLHFAGPVSFDERQTGHHVSAYVQDAVHASERVTVDLGVRFDRHRLGISEVHLSPRVNVGWRLSRSGTLLHGSYDHLFVPPPVENVLLSSAGLTNVIREIGRPLPPLPATVENQFELGLTQPLASAVEVGLTRYYRRSENPVHTAVWPDARIYSYASFDRARAYGVETRLTVHERGQLGLAGYLNYALGRVHFYGPVTGGFIAEAEHLTDASRFLAPMDQTHTLTAGLTYRHARSGILLGATFEYGSGTPIGHGHAEEESPGDGEAHSHGSPAAAAEERVPGHFTQNLTAAVDLLRDENRRPRLTLQINVENLTNDVSTMAQESVFTPGQFSMPRLVSAALKVRF